MQGAMGGAGQAEAAGPPAKLMLQHGRRTISAMPTVSFNSPAAAS